MKSNILAAFALALSPFIIPALADSDPTVPDRESIMPIEADHPGHAHTTAAASDDQSVTKRDPGMFKYLRISHDGTKRVTKTFDHFEQMTKRGDWAGAYDYAATWDATETAGGYQATHNGGTSVGFYGLPLGRRAEVTGGASGRGKGMGNGHDQDRGERQLGGDGDEGKEDHVGDGQGQGGKPAA